MLALTRRPGRDLSRVELTHLERTPIAAEVALRQHDAYRAALASAGAQLIDLPALDDHPDAVFVEDVLLALPELFILTRPGAASRQGEVASVAAALPRDRPLERMDAPATLDGGDVLRVGRNFYVGRSRRTNDDGIAALRRLVEPRGYRVVAVDIDGALHLKTAVTAISDELLLVNPAWVDASAFGALARIETDPREPFAGNCLVVGERRFMQAAHAATAGRVRRAGFAVELIEIGEFAKAEAGLTCLSVLVP